MNNVFQISFKNENHPLKSHSILVSTNGIINAPGGSYELIEGNTEEIPELIQKEQ